MGMKLGVDTTNGDTAKYKSIKIKAERHWWKTDKETEHTLS